MSTVCLFVSLASGIVCVWFTCGSDGGNKYDSGQQRKVLNITARDKSKGIILQLYAAAASASTELVR